MIGLAQWVVPIKAAGMSSPTWRDACTGLHYLSGPPNPHFSFTCFSWDVVRNDAAVSINGSNLKVDDGSDPFVEYSKTYTWDEMSEKFRDPKEEIFPEGADVFAENCHVPAQFSELGMIDPNGLHQLMKDIPEADLPPGYHVTGEGLSITTGLPTEDQTIIYGNSDHGNRPIEPDFILHVMSNLLDESERLRSNAVEDDVVDDTIARQWAQGWRLNDIRIRFGLGGYHPYRDWKWRLCALDAECSLEKLKHAIQDFLSDADYVIVRARWKFHDDAEIDKVRIFANDDDISGALDEYRHENNVREQVSYVETWSHNEVDAQYKNFHWKDRATRDLPELKGLPKGPIGDMNSGWTYVATAGDGGRPAPFGLQTVFPQMSVTTNRVTTVEKDCGRFSYRDGDVATQRKDYVWIHLWGGQSKTFVSDAVRIAAGERQQAEVLQDAEMIVRSAWKRSKVSCRVN